MNGENKDSVGGQQGEEAKKRQERVDLRDNVVEHEQMVKGLGQKFEVTHALWLHKPTRTFQTSLDNEYDPLDRFDTIGSKLQGQLWDIMDVLPVKYHDDLQKCCSVMECKNKGQIWLVVFELEAQLYFNVLKETYEYHINYAGKFDVKSVFLNPILQKLHNTRARICDLDERRGAISCYQKQRNNGPEMGVRPYYTRHDCGLCCSGK
ncbi:hypothetical protein SERLA73DRAFT_155389 [Serpula lacrymans var. lacrymans S7.3]|uniref:Uncharacterized protein n=1 Tax=Serpula lacrymans var. lacrymans (strain S7.3) TaxID=936435 RepID=F8Q9P5_SERL3|nr:hypothetical protein SERLA73DRAFT_155389 [Serpula lacrymans var. lacrymans S7.3]